MFFVLWYENEEQLTKDILGEFLVRYGKVVDEEKEKKRLGMIQSKAAIGVVSDYDLPVTPQQYIQSVMPMFYDKYLPLFLSTYLVSNFGNILSYCFFYI